MFAKRQEWSLAPRSLCQCFSASCFFSERSTWAALEWVLRALKLGDGWGNAVWWWRRWGRWRGRSGGWQAELEPQVGSVKCAEELPPAYAVWGRLWWGWGTGWWGWRGEWGGSKANQSSIGESIIGQNLNLTLIGQGLTKYLKGKNSLKISIRR